MYIEIQIVISKMKKKIKHILLWFLIAGPHSVCPALTSDAWINSGKGTLWKNKFKCLRKEEGQSIQHVSVRSVKGWKEAVFIGFCAVFQVFDGYVDDCRNTDNAWVEMIVYNIHLSQTSQELVDVNNVVRTRTFPWDGRSAAMQLDCCVIVFLIGQQQPWLSWVAGGELQNKPQLTPNALPGLGGQDAQQQVLILPRVVHPHWKPQRNAEWTRVSDPTVLHTHTCWNADMFQIQSSILTCAIRPQVSLLFKEIAWMQELSKNIGLRTEIYSKYEENI